MVTAWMAGSDFPCYFLWPRRTPRDSFWLLESQTHRYVDLQQACFLHPLGIRHFYDAFGLRAEVSIRAAAFAAFQFEPSEVSSDLVISSKAAVARGWAEHQEQPVDQTAPEADRRNVPDEVISVSASEVDSASSHGDDSSYESSSDASYSSDSSGAEPPLSEVSDQHSMLEHAYSIVQNAFVVHEDGTLENEEASLNMMDLFPPHWPLAKMTLPLKFGVNRLDRLVAGYLMELIATQPDPSLCRKQISSFAKTLTVRVAMYLAKPIASLFRPVLSHPYMALTDDDTISLLTSEFWVRPVYEELLHAASRFHLSPAAEFKRPTSNLVKIASHPKNKPQDKKNNHESHSTITDWLGADCPVDFLNVWFPAHWAPMVFQEMQQREIGKTISCGLMSRHTLLIRRS